MNEPRAPRRRPSGGPQHTARPVLTAHEVEQSIVDLSDELEHLIEEYADIAERAALTEVDLKREQAMMTLAVIEHPPTDEEGNPRKLTVDERAARVELNVTDQRREAALAGASRETAREALNTHRTRIEALRTLAANVRYATGPNT